MNRQKLWTATSALIAAFTISACDAEPRSTTIDAPAPTNLRDAPLSVDELNDAGFTASMVLDGERIGVVADARDMTMHLVVRGEATYATWTVDFAGHEGTGQVAGIQIENTDPDRWQQVNNERAAEVLTEIAVQAGQLITDHYSEDDRGAVEVEPPAPGTDALLDGLRILVSVRGFLESRPIDDLAAAPEGQAPPFDGFAAEGDPAAGGSCHNEWACDISVAMGCVGPSAAGPWWWKVTQCAYSALSGCGFLCAATNYAEYWDGNCLKSVSAYANHSNTIYCVGGGCSGCY